MRIGTYWDELQEIKRKFDAYQANSEAVLRRAAQQVCSSVITLGEIGTFRPFERERRGLKLDGKLIPAPVASEDCYLYQI